MRRVRLTLDDPVLAAQAVDLSYALPGSGRIQDLAGNDAAALTSETVTNLTGTDPGDLFFNGDFETGDLSQYPDLHDIAVGYRDDELIVTPGLEGGSTYAFRCRASDTISSHTGAGPSMFAADLLDRPYERPGIEEWVRFLYLLPSGGDVDYPGQFIVPGPGNWHTIHAFHEPGGFAGSPHFGLNGAAGGRPSFWFQWRGGAAASRMLLWHWDEDENRNHISIEYDHVYEIIFRILWDHEGAPGTSDGYVESWIDGRQWVPPPSGVDIYGNPWPDTFPTLWRYDNGLYAPTWSELGTYRGNTGTPSIATETSVYLDSYKKGSTLASVGG